MSKTRTVAMNAGWLLTGRVATMLIQSVTAVLVPRFYGAATYGQYATAVALVGIVLPLLSAGTQQVLLRDGSRRLSLVRPLVGRILELNVAVYCLALVAMALVTSLLGYEGEVQALIFILSVGGLFATLRQNFVVTLQIEERMHWIGIGTPLSAVLVAGAILLAITLDLSVRVYAAGTVLATLAGLILLGVVAGRGLPAERAAELEEGGRPVLLRARRRVWSYLLRTGWPFALSALFFNVFFQIGVILLAALRTSEEVGVFNVAFRILAILILVPNALVASILPTLLGYGADVARIQPLLRRMSRYVLFLALPLSAGALVLADPLMPWLFGEEFRPSVPVLRVIGVVLALRFHTVVMTNVFVAHHRELLRTGLQAVAVTIAVAANLVLVPGLGFMGTAFATLATEVFLWSSYVVALGRMGHRPLGLWIWRPLVAAAVMGATCWGLREALPVPGVIGVGVVVYVAALALLGAFEAEDRSMLRRLTRRAGGDVG